MVTHLKAKFDRPEVAIVKGEPPFDESRIKSMVKDAIELIGGVKSIVKAGDTVLIKPNWLAPIPNPATTDPRVVKALIEIFREAGAKRVVVSEYAVPHGKVAPYLYGAWKSLRDVVKKLGYDRYVEDAGGELIPFEDVELVEVKVEGGKILRKARVPKLVLEADVLVDVPVMKTHFYTLVTLGIKNMHGILPDDLKTYAHKEDLDQFLVDIIKIRPPDLTVIDGIRALEGYDHHVTMKDVVDMGVIIASRDVVAADAVAATVMGFNPLEEITHIRIAHMEGVGVGDLNKIVVKGNSILEVRRIFKRPDQRLFGIYPNVEIYSGGACNYCIVRTKVALARLEEEGRLPSEKFTIILGHKPILPEDPGELPGQVILIGDCAINAVPEWCKLKLRLENRLAEAPGCPPMWTLDMATMKLFPPKK
jgi:uncharacterized protein (DUF362 family)